MLPDAEQRLLRGVLGELDVAEDPVRHRQEPIRNGIDQVGKCLLVAALCTCHELGVHVPSNAATPVQPDATTGMGDMGARFFNPMGG